MNPFTLSQCYFRGFSVRNVYVYFSGFVCLDLKCQALSPWQWSSRQ